MRLVVFCVSLLVAIALCGATEDPAEEPLPLPASSGNQELKLGEKIALDHLGPLIVTADGSLRRIANWQALSAGERAVALRRLTKRNKERLATLEELQQGQGQQQQQQGKEEQQQAGTELEQVQAEL